MVSRHKGLEGIVDSEMDDRVFHTGLVVVVSVRLYFVDQITLTSCGVENLSLIVVVQLQISSVSLHEPGIFCHFPVRQLLPPSQEKNNMDSILSSLERFLFPLIMGFLLVLGCSGSVSASVDV